MHTAKGNAIYTAFATAVFTAVQYISGITDPLSLLITALMFFVFTFAMLRLINRVMAVVIDGFSKRRKAKEEANRGPEALQPTTERPDHVRRRRERSRRRRR